MDQTSIDAKNREYWQHVCGSNQAKEFGYDGDDAASIANFDRWFFGIYPYLDRYIPFRALAGKDVLEVGLGYGSVSQRLAETGANLVGLDISAAPVNWLNHRLALSGLKGRAIEGSALSMPFDDESFDYLVTIGCLHHTGNMQKAISEVHRVLRKGGCATIMSYNATSYVRWLRYRSDTWRYVRSVWSGAVDPLPLASDGRADFDHDARNNVAPETVVVSKGVLKHMLRDFSKCNVYRTNVTDHQWFGRGSRNIRNALMGPLLGLDLYAVVTK